MLQYVLVLLSDEEVEGWVRRSIPSHGIHVRGMLLGRILIDVLHQNFIWDSELYIRFCWQAIGVGRVGNRNGILIDNIGLQDGSRGVHRPFGRTYQDYSELRTFAW